MLTSVSAYYGKDMQYLENFLMIQLYNLFLNVCVISMLCLSWYDSPIPFTREKICTIYNIFHILFWYTEYDRPRNIVTDISYSTITDDMIYYLFHHFPPSIYDGGK